MDFENGILRIEGESFCPGYSFEMFRHSAFFNNQDGIRIIYLDGVKQIEGKKFIISLFFRDYVIYMISLICCDKDFTPETEKERKVLHDKILSEHCIMNEKEFPWGKVTSEYDDRSNLSSINLIYN